MLGRDRACTGLWLLLLLLDLSGLRLTLLLAFTGLLLGLLCCRDLPELRLMLLRFSLTGLLFKLLLIGVLSWLPLRFLCCRDFAGLLLALLL